jgi:hypothetical protein
VVGLLRTAGGPLPKGSTETGSWAIAEGKPVKVLGGLGSQTSISFAIALAKRLMMRTYTSSLQEKKGNERDTGMCRDLDNPKRNWASSVCLRCYALHAGICGLLANPRT